MSYSVAYHPNYVLPVPENHRFPMEKYDLLQQQLVYRGVVSEQQLFEPTKVALDKVIAIHNERYISNFVNGNLSKAAIRRIGFAYTPMLVERELTLVQGTVEGALRALKDGIAFNIAGGTHHACYAHGEGFCMINDQAVAAYYLWQHITGMNKILIIDLDVHQGNGTADLLGRHPDILTFSMHCEHNYPFRKAQSHIDVGLEDGITDDEYLTRLNDHLKKLFARFRPNFIFYQSGVDILATDKMGKLQCSQKGCAARDRLVFEWAKKYNIPVQCSMGGGYSHHISDILEAHTSTFIQANELGY